MHWLSFMFAADFHHVTVHVGMLGWRDEVREDRCRGEPRNGAPEVWAFGLELISTCL